jgi:predicted ATPase
VLTKPLPQLAIPATLHDSLAARLDRLGAAREVAQIASTIGREFSARLLAAVASVPELDTALEPLLDAGLLEERGEATQPSYAFRHNLVRDAAYGTLLLSRRAELHEKIGWALERNFAELAEQQPEVVANHFTEANLPAPAVKWWIKAGQQALTRSANVEAVSHLQRALDLQAALPQSRERDETELAVRRDLAEPLFVTKGFASQETEMNYRRMASLAEQLRNDERLFTALWGQCVVALARAELTSSSAKACECLRFAERLNAPVMLLASHSILEYILLAQGKIAEAREHAELALSLYDPGERARYIADFTIDPKPRLISHLALILQQQGHLDDAKAAADRALFDAQEGQHYSTLAFVLYQLAIFWLIAGDDARLVRIVNELSSLSTRYEHPYWHLHCEIFRGLYEARNGRVIAGLARIEGAFAERRQLRASIWLPQYLVEEAELLTEHGLAKQALVKLDEAALLISGTEHRFSEPEIFRLRGLALRAQGARAAEIEASLMRSLELARQRGARLWELRAATSLAQYWRDVGCRPEALSLLAPVWEAFPEGHAEPALAAARAVVTELRGG